MADTTDVAPASPHYQMARENTQNVDEKIQDDKIANEAGIDPLDGESYSCTTRPLLTIGDDRRKHRCM
jgi:hypothetical protein